MGRKKAVKELTEKEWLEREKECGLNEIKDKLNFINPPTYEFNIGDKVKFGNLKDATVDYISKDKKVYGLVCTRVNINHGNPYEDKTYMVVAWNEIRPLSIIMYLILQKIKILILIFRTLQSKALFLNIIILVLI